jgi:hypothetical protein
MTVTYFADCGAISPEPCTMYTGIDVLVPWHDNWRHLSYWVMMEPAVLAVIALIMVLWGWRRGIFRGEK